jgi:hypothetical protein
MLILDNASVHHTQMSDVDVDVELSSANYQVGSQRSMSSDRCHLTISATLLL